jgi:hypothetical protein
MGRGRHLIIRLCISRVTVRILIELRRIPRTFRASNMRATSTHFLLTDEGARALVTSTVDPLLDLLANSVLLLRLGRNDITILGRGFALGRFGFKGRRNNTTDVDPGHLSMILTVFSFLDGITRTFLAALMFTLRADPIGAKGGLATMTLTVDSHTNRLVNPFNRLLDRGHRPFVRFEGQSILLKQSTSPLLLDGRTTGGLRGCLFLNRRFDLCFLLRFTGLQLGDVSRRRDRWAIEWRSSIGSNIARAGLSPGFITLQGGLGLGDELVKALASVATAGTIRATGTFTGSGGAHDGY